MKTIEQSRKEMRDYLGDMEALRPFIDNDKNESLIAAFSVARARAMEAAEDYVRAIEADQKLRDA